MLQPSATDIARDTAASYRDLAAAVLRRALDDLAIPSERDRARGFLLFHFQATIWADWLPVRPAVMSRAIKSGVRRRSSRDTPRLYRRVDLTAVPDPDDA